jgi:hypothetical protein
MEQWPLNYRDGTVAMDRVVFPRRSPPLSASHCCTAARGLDRYPYRQRSRASHIRSIPIRSIPIRSYLASPYLASHIRSIHHPDRQH